MKPTLIIFAVLLGYSYAFDCFTCNNKPEDDDTKTCEDQVETCSEGVTSCSTVVFTSLDEKEHTRKFCTATGTPIYQYLMFFPGSSLCQNIETGNAGPQPPAPPPVRIPTSRGKMETVNPPSPPQQQTSNLLCVCTKELCNGGSYREVLHKNLLKNMKSEENEIGNEIFE